MRKLFGILRIVAGSLLAAAGGLGCTYFGVGSTSVKLSLYVPLPRIIGYDVPQSGFGGAFLFLFLAVLSAFIAMWGTSIAAGGRDAFMMKGDSGR